MTDDDDERIYKQAGKIRVRVFWLTSIVLSVLLTLVLNLILHLILH